MVGEGSEGVDMEESITAIHHLLDNTILKTKARIMARHLMVMVEVVGQCTVLMRKIHDVMRYLRDLANLYSVLHKPMHSPLRTGKTAFQAQCQALTMGLQ